MRQTQAEQQSESGFTLVEMMIAVTLIAIFFTAVAGVLGSSLKILAVNKARAQGNDVATQAIEDLQRHPYAALALCGPPIAAQAPAGTTVPADLNLTVFSKKTDCPNPTTADEAASKYGDDPCEATPSEKGVPKAYYQCTRFNGTVTYNIRRFVAWTDSGQTAKRMAVFVHWSDASGLHEVSQQSSLRSPVSGDVVGIDPPAFVAPTMVGSGTAVDHVHTTTADGYTQSPISVTATTTGTPSSTDDRAFVSYLGWDGTEVSKASFGLSNLGTVSGKTTWSGSLPTNTRVPPGTQYFTFNVVRDSDGKVSSLVDTPAMQFCPGDCPTGGPEFVLDAALADGTPAVSQSAVPLPVEIDAEGKLESDVNIRATTRNLLGTDSLTFILRTRTGNVLIGMRQTSCGDETCEWAGTIAIGSGYRLAEGTQSVYFTASQALTDYTASAPSTLLEVTIA